MKDELKMQLFQGELEHFSAEGALEIASLRHLASQGHLDNAISIRISSGPQSDLTFLSQLKNLVRLDVHIKSSKPVNLSQLPLLTNLKLSEKFVTSVEAWPARNQLDTLVLKTPSSETLTKIGGLAKFLYVSSPPLVFPEVDAPNTTKELKIFFSRSGHFDVTNVAQFSNLETLSFYSCPGTISNSHALEALKNLSNVNIYNAPNLDDYEWLFKLPKLKRVLFLGKNDLPAEAISKRLISSKLMTG